MRVKLKVCCISSRDEAERAIAAGAWAIGLVGPQPSGPGIIDDALITDIAAATKGRVRRFLLTSRTDADDVVDHVRATGVDTVQLTDRVSAGVYTALRRALPDVTVVQVIHVVGPESLADAEAAVAGGAGMLLLDSGRPDAAVRELGGTGRVHDWTVSREIAARSAVPVFLAGGLTPANVGAAIRDVRPFGVDLCSGIRVDGALDAVRLGAFVAAMSDAVSGDYVS